MYLVNGRLSNLLTSWKTPRTLPGLPACLIGIASTVECLNVVSRSTSRSNLSMKRSFVNITNSSMIQMRQDIPCIYWLCWFCNFWNQSCHHFHFLRLIFLVVGKGGGNLSYRVETELGLVIILLSPNCFFPLSWLWTLKNAQSPHTLSNYFYLWFFRFCQIEFSFSTLPKISISIQNWEKWLRFPACHASFFPFIWWNWDKKW